MDCPKAARSKNRSGKNRPGNSGQLILFPGVWHGEKCLSRQGAGYSARPLGLLGCGHPIGDSGADGCYGCRALQLRWEAQQSILLIKSACQGCLKRAKHFAGVMTLLDVACDAHHYLLESWTSHGSAG